MPEPKSGINPNRTHFNAGAAKNSSGASFAKELRHWLYNTQQVFAKQADFAAAIPASAETVQWWLTGRAFPSDPLCDNVYSITQLNCFSASGRTAARREHEQKRGLSHAAIAKREKRQYLTPEELKQCLADPERAFTIRGDDWIACLECGQLLKQIRDRGSAAHLKNEHGEMSAVEYRIGRDPTRPRYGPKRGLVCSSRSAEMTAELEKREHKLPPGTAAFLATVRPSQKGQKQPPEHGRKQRQRSGQRKPEWSKGVADVDFVWQWLIENKPLDEVAASLKFTLGGAWVRLKAIIGAPVRKLTRSTAPDLASAERAVRLIFDSGGDIARLKVELAGLCKESRDKTAARIADGTARRALLWIPRVRTWLDRTQCRVKSSIDVARVFVATQLKVNTAKSSAAPAKGRGRPAEKAKMFAEARRLRNSGMSWSKISQRLDPMGFAKSPRGAAERIRQGANYSPKKPA